MQTAKDLDDFFSIPDPWGYDVHPDDKRRSEYLLSILPSSTPDRVLDIGCGSGYLTTQLPGREIVGVDLSPAAIGWARERASRLEMHGLSFEVASILDLDDLAIGRFDLVIVTGVLYRQYIGHAFTSVSASILRRLIPGGYLVQAHIDAWFKHAFPLNRVAARMYPYRDYMHRLEVYKA